MTGVRTDKKYLEKLIQYIYYWQSDSFTDCKYDVIGNKVILIDSSITKDVKKFIHHIELYIDSTRELPAYAPCSFPEICLSNDYKYLKITRHFTQKIDWVCPFVIHNPNPKIKISPIIEVQKVAKQKKQNGKPSQLLFQ